MASKDSSNKDQKDQKVVSHISPDTIRVYGETIGISALPDEATQFIADHATYCLKRIIQDASKHMHHAKRRKLITSDMDMTLQAKGVEPLYGIKASEHIPFRYASGGGRELHFYEDKEMDLSEMVGGSLPKVPLDVSLKAHWLSVEGVQPAVPENPPAASKELQKKEILDTGVKNLIDKGHKMGYKPGAAVNGLPPSAVDTGKGPGSASSRVGLKKKKPESNMVLLKDLTNHELSVEQQFFYKEATEACVGPEENKRSEALNSLAMDPGLHQMLPRFIEFVREGVTINVAQNNLALLIYLMRMVKSILDNPHLYLEKYLHRLLPGVLTCVVSQQLCLRPESDNHWALRDFAARLVGTICKNFSTCVNHIQSRVTQVYVQGLTSKRAMSTHYGALAGLGELGPEVIKACIIPHLKTLGENMRQAIEGPITNAIDKIACEHIKKQITKHVPKEIKAMGMGGDTLEEYSNTFGYLGPLLFSAVQKEKQASVLATPATITTRPTLQIGNRVTQQFVLQQPGSASTPLTPGASSFFSTAGGVVSRTPSIPSSAGGTQKIVLVTSQPPRSVPEMGTVAGPGGASSTSSTIVKVVSAAPASSVTGGAATTLQAGAGQKIVVIQGGNIKQEPPPTPTTTHTPMVITTSAQDLGQGMKSVFPAGQQSFSISVKKEEKP